jgi:DNA replication protein DnaC
MERLADVGIDPDLRAKLDAFKAKVAELATLPQGPPLNPPDGLTTCEVCEGAGWYRNSDARYVRCSCVFSESSAQGVPYEFQAITLDTYGEREGQKTALARARDFCAVTSGRDVYLFGGVGAGKTRLACAMANTCHRKRVTVHFARVPMLLHQLQPGRENNDLENRLMAVSVLVLDDIGAERDVATDYTRRTLLMLYEARHDEGKRTVFTSNKSIQELADMQDDDRLTSRIAGRSDVIRLTTPDQRLMRRVK